MCARPSLKLFFVQSTLRRRRSYYNERTEWNDTSSVKNSPSIYFLCKDLRTGDDGWLEMELVFIAQVCVPSFRLSPRIFFRLQVFSLLCVPFWLLAFVFVHEPKNSCYVLTSLIQRLHDEQFLITYALYRS